MTVNAHVAHGAAPGDVGLGSTIGARDQLALAFQDGVAAQARTGHQDDEADVRVIGGDGRGDQAAFGMADQADMFRIDVGTRFEGRPPRLAHR